MNNQDSSESQIQGFIPNKLKILSSQIKQDPPFIQKYTSFQPKYIFGNPMLKKEPIQMLEGFDSIQIRPQNTVSISESKLVNHEKTKKTVHELYMNQSQYNLVYSRFKEPFSRQLKASFEHQVKLKGSFLNMHKFRKLRQAQILTDFSKFNLNIPENQQLVFDSKFEGGNLLCAFKCLKQKNSYVLFIQNDTNTYGYNQSFYFSIKNAKPAINYTFSIVNFKKKYSFFTKGMQPLIFSYEEYKSKGNGWYRDGSNINYHKSYFQEPQCETYYTLQFSITFMHQNDYISITTNPPYSYTKLIKFIEECKPIAQSKLISLETSSICQSLGGNNVPYVIISKKQQIANQKSIIIILARQHSGQTWSSFLMEQIIRYIITQCNHLQNWLLSNYQFHIFPMINVDGVIYGNFRCDLSGYDLNRCWKNPSKYIHPQNYYIKQQIEKLSKKNIQLFLDLHTHSNAFGSFAYSCVQSEQGRKLPKLMNKITSLFQYSACTFNIEKQKQLTARAITYQFTKNVNTITIQLSSYGYKNYLTKNYSYFTLKQIKILSKCFINSFIVCKTNVDIFIFCQLNINSTNNIVQQQMPQVLDSDSQPQIDQIEMSKKLQNIFPNHIKRQFLLKNKKTMKKGKKRKDKRSQLKNRSVDIQNQCDQDEHIRNRVKTQYQSTKSKIQNNNQDVVNSFSESISFKQTCSKRTMIFNKMPQKKINQSFSNKSRLKMLAQKEAKPLNFVQFSLKKLPIFANSIINRGGFKMVLQNKVGFSLKPTNNNNNKKAALFQLTGFNSGNKSLLSTQYRNNDKLKQKINKKLQSQKYDYPFLCILSDNKKKQQFLQKKQQNEMKKTIKKAYNISSLKEHSFFENSRQKKKSNIVQQLQKSWMKNAFRYYPYLQNDQ